VIVAAPEPLAIADAIYDGLRNNAGVRPEAVMINLVEVRKENCSFGNGIAQYT